MFIYERSPDQLRVWQVSITGPHDKNYDTPLQAQVTHRTRGCMVSNGGALRAHYLFALAISVKTRQPNLSFPRPTVLDHAAAGVMGNFRLQ